MYHVSTVERDDDGNLYCFHQISCSQLGEAARFVNEQQQFPLKCPGMTIIRTVIESEPKP